DTPLPTEAGPPSWNVSMDTQAQQLVLHFSSRMPATFSAAWSHSGLGQDSMVPPVYSVSQLSDTRLIVPFLRGWGALCPQVWRSDVPVCLKHLLCPDVSHRLLGLLILALLAFTTLLGVVLVLTCQRPLSGKLTGGNLGFRLAWLLGQLPPSLPRPGSLPKEALSLPLRPSSLYPRR
uniref:Interleukin-17 receptor C/E N-terminal domain-containing protein n=1 Tax=Balaenoptera musculus TaxID=9771 RepID=A0A8C0HXG5_BALMU